jgi:antitoxin (DNA-binding transcriptional repressor) of toxin-antitoxin stability system
MTMKKVNIYEAKARLSEYVEAAERGERVVICRRNRAVAELRRIGDARTSPRPVGGAEAGIEIPETFFEPLPASFVDAFYDSAAPRADSPMVAERAPAHRKSRSRKPRTRR